MKHLIITLLLAATAYAATPADYATPVTAAGEYSFPASIPAGNRCTYQITGSFSGAAVTPGYITTSGTFTALGPAVTAPATLGPYAIPLGPATGKGTPALTITGGVSPAIILTVTQVSGGEIPINAASITTALGYTPADAAELAISSLSRPLSVACVGTSITQQSSILATDINPRIHDRTNGHAGWLEHLTNHKIRLVRRTGVFESYTDKTFGYPGFGITGLTTGSGGVYPLDNAIASGAEVLVLEGGTNDVTGGETSASIITKITAYWTKAVNSGARVIALNIPPMGSSIINSTKRDVLITVNAALPALAASLGVTLVDAYAAATIDGSGYATTESAFDAIHPTPAYAQRIAALIASPLNTWAANRPPEIIVPNAQGGLTTAGSFSVGLKYVIASIGTTNFVSVGSGANTVGVEFTATGVGTGTGTAYVANAVWITAQPNPSQNTKPNAWVASGTFTPTYTAVTDADGTLWQRVRMLQSGTANSIMKFSVNPTTGFLAGDRVRFSCRIRPVSGGAFDALEVGFYGAAYDTTAPNTKYYRAITGGANLGTGNYNAITGLFVSPIFTIGATMIPSPGLYAVIEIYGNDVEFDIRDYGIFKVIENP